MRRAFWVALGLGAGAAAAILASRWMKRQAERVAPANLGRQARSGLQDLAALVRQAVAEGRAAMQEKEAEVRTSLG